MLDLSTFGTHFKMEKNRVWSVSETANSNGFCLGFKVLKLGFMFFSLGLEILGLRFEVSGLGFEVLRLGFKVLDPGGVETSSFFAGLRDFVFLRSPY